MSTAAKAEQLHLHEALLLLVLRDQEGVIHWRASMWQYSLGGALLAELAMTERVELTADKKPYLVLRSDAPLGDELLDECLTKIANAKRRARAQDWVSRFAQLPRLRKRVAASLCRRGILKTEERQILLIFRRTVFPEIDPGPERRIVERMRRAIVGNASEVDPTTSILIALLEPTGALRIHFDAALLKANKRRIKEITSGSRVGGANKAAIEAAQAAVTACIVAATAAAAAASG